VYIGADLAMESAIPHERLHASAAPEFLQTVGVALSEGVTKQLALEVTAASGLRGEKVPAYNSCGKVAGAIFKVTGRDPLCAPTSIAASTWPTSSAPSAPTPWAS